MSKITYDDKSDISTSAVPAANKIIAADMNEIKSVVNTNDTSLGDLTNLTTTEKGSLVGAVNELDGDIGNLSTLTTTDKTNLVNAINELQTSNIYASSEVETGEKWENGETVYKKTVKVSRTTQSGFQVNWDISPTPTHLVDLVGVAEGNDGRKYVLYCVDSTDQFRVWFGTANAMNVEIGSSYPTAPFTAYFTMKYTKY